MNVRRATARLGSDAAVLAVPLLLLVLGFATFWGVTIDDAYISALYARNLATGQGLVFNVGERVEGFSNPLWVFLMAGAHRFLGATTIETARILGITATIGAMFVVNRALRSTGVAPKVTAVTLSLAAASPELPFWSIAGLETTLYSLLTVGALMLFAHEDREAIFSPAMGVLAAASALLRPEGVIVFFACLAVVTWCNARTPARLLASSWGVTLFLAIVGAYLAFRVHYFGTWLPNTFLVKAGGIHRLLEGARYLLGLLSSPCAAILVGGALFAIPLARISPRIRALALVVALDVGFTLWAGGDWMPLGRFRVPLLLLCACMAGYGLPRCLERVRRSFWWRRVPSASVGLALGAVFVQVAVVWQARREHHWRIAHGLDTRIAWAHWLEQRSPRDLLIAHGDVGALAFHSGRRLLDLNGLVDRPIAVLRRRYKGAQRDRLIVDYVRARAPEVVVFVAFQDPALGFRPSDSVGKLLASSLGTQYELRASLVALPPGRVPAYKTGRYAVIAVRNDVSLPGLEAFTECCNRAILSGDSPSRRCI